MQFSLNQKIPVLMAEAESSGGWYNQRPEGHTDAGHSKGPRKRQPEAKGRETVILISPGVKATCPIYAYPEHSARKGQGVGENGKK